MTSKAKDYESLLDTIITTIIFLHEAGLPVNDGVMDYIKAECERRGYEPPMGVWEI